MNWTFLFDCEADSRFATEPLELFAKAGLYEMLSRYRTRGFIATQPCICASCTDEGVVSEVGATSTVLIVCFPFNLNPQLVLKNMKKQFRKAAPLKTVVAMSLLIALAACSSNDDDATPVDGDGSEQPDGPGDGDANGGALEVVSVTLDTAQEIPATTGVPDAASGTGTLSVDESGNVVAEIGVSGLTGAATMAHIHRGFAGRTGPVLIGLTSADGGNTWSVPDDARSLDADEIAAFERGELYFNVHTEANPAGEIRGQIDPGNATRFLVRLENVSTADTLVVASNGTTQAVPLSPGAFIVHRAADDSPLLLPRDAANAALESVAEDGNPAPTPDSAYPAVVPGASIFNTPLGADAPGPIGPGGAYEFTVQALDGDKLGFVTMFVPSNDWFYTPTDEDNSIDLFVDGQPVAGDVSDQIAIWDAGTEVDQEPGTGADQVQRQAGAANVGDVDPDTRVSSLGGRGQSVNLNGSVLQVTITPVP